MSNTSKQDDEFVKEGFTPDDLIKVQKSRIYSEVAQLISSIKIVILYLTLIGSLYYVSCEISKSF